MDNQKQIFFEEQKKANVKYNIEKAKKAAAKKYSLPHKVISKKYTSSVDTTLLLDWKG